MRHILHNVSPLPLWDSVCFSADQSYLTIVSESNGPSGVLDPFGLSMAHFEVGWASVRSRTKENLKGLRLLDLYELVLQDMHLRFHDLNDH